MSNPELVKRSKASKIADPSKGGKARAASLSPEERREIAQEAAQVRWGSTLPRAEHMGVLEIAGRPVSCAVLDSGKRLLTQETFMTVIGRAAKPKAGTGSERLTQDDKLLNGLPPFLAAANLAPFVSDELRALTTRSCFALLKEFVHLGMPQSCYLLFVMFILKRAGVTDFFLVNSILLMHVNF